MSDRPPAAIAPPMSLPVESSQPSPQQARGDRPSLGISGTYIDPTDYSLGATRYGQPDSIVLSERSTGCQAILQQGQAMPNSVCSTAGNGTMAHNANGRSVNVGPLSFSANGIGVGSTSPSGQNFYNRTLRPQALPGNGNVGLMFPLSIPSVITSAFGWRIHPITGDQRLHQGTDIGAPTGTPIVAAFAGRVTTADFLGGYGLTVILRHNDSSLETLYAHMSELFVRPGEWVEQGSVIGRVGSTGNSTGPHLHFEVRQQTADGWIAMDPGQLLQYAMAQLTHAINTGDFHAMLPGFNLKENEPAVDASSDVAKGLLKPLEFGRVAAKASGLEQAALEDRPAQS